MRQRAAAQACTAQGKRLGSVDNTHYSLNLAVCVYQDPVLIVSAAPVYREPGCYYKAHLLCPGHNLTNHERRATYII